MTQVDWTHNLNRANQLIKEHQINKSDIEKWRQNPNYGICAITNAILPPRLTIDNRVKEFAAVGAAFQSYLATESTAA